MPYDLRFDGPDSDNNGIKNDFPRRVLRHYVEHILPKIKNPNLKKNRILFKNTCQQRENILKEIIKDLVILI